MLRCQRTNSETQINVYFFFIKTSTMILWHLDQECISIRNIVDVSFSFLFLSVSSSISSACLCVRVCVLKLVLFSKTSTDVLKIAYEHGHVHVIVCFGSTNQSFLFHSIQLYGWILFLFVQLFSFLGAKYLKRIAVERTAQFNAGWFLCQILHTKQTEIYFICRQMILHFFLSFHCFCLVWKEWMNKITIICTQMYANVIAVLLITHFFFSQIARPGSINSKPIEEKRKEFELNAIAKWILQRIDENKLYSIYMWNI